jgi:hypothetical protein
VQTAAEDHEEVMLDDFAGIVRSWESLLQQTGGYATKRDCKINMSVVLGVHRIERGSSPSIERS